MNSTPSPDEAFSAWVQSGDQILNRLSESAQGLQTQIDRLPALGLMEPFNPQERERIVSKQLSWIEGTNQHLLLDHFDYMRRFMLGVVREAGLAEKKVTFPEIQRGKTETRQREETLEGLLNYVFTDVRRHSLSTINLMMRTLGYFIRLHATGILPEFPYVDQGSGRVSEGEATRRRAARSTSPR